MSSNCTDSTNEQYKLYWFNYFVSIGYIDSSSLGNAYAPYGKCTTSLLWITYLINLIHFFLLSSGIIYVLTSHQNKSGFWWPFTTWAFSFGFLLISIVFFIIRDVDTTVFFVLIIGFQLSTVIVLWISIFIVVAFAFTIEYRYQRCLFLLIIILSLIQVGCLLLQTLITLHCTFNIKLTSTSLDYGCYWSAIIAAIGTIASTLLFDHIFIWSKKQLKIETVSPVSVARPLARRSRETSPIASNAVEEFNRRPSACLYHIYSNPAGTRHFRIQPQPIELNKRTTDRPKVQHIGCQTNMSTL